MYFSKIIENNLLMRGMYILGETPSASEMVTFYNVSTNYNPKEVCQNFLLKCCEVTAFFLKLANFYDVKNAVSSLEFET